MGDDAFLNKQGEQRAKRRAAQKNKEKTSAEE
jgi:hypothetical protein